MEIKVRTIIEIVGKPKEHVEKTMEKVVELITKNEEFKLVSHETREPKEVKNLWSSFTEFVINFSSLDVLSNFCFEFMPSSVEIEEPEKISMNSKEIENLLNDILSKIHQYDMVLKKFMLKEMKEKNNSSPSK